MSKIGLLGAAVAGSILAAPTTFAANVVLDGDFNNSNPSFTTISSGSSFGPWTVTSGSIDLIGGYWQSPSGPNFPSGTNGSVDLDGVSVGTISQAIGGLTAGNTYTLTFWLSGNPDGPPATKSLDVSIGSAVNDHFTYTIGTNTHTNMMYTAETLAFTADATNTLSFASRDSASPGTFGPVIGGVAIAAVPEPATWAMMVLGIAGLGFAAYRKAGPASSLT